MILLSYGIIIIWYHNGKRHYNIKRDNAKHTDRKGQTKLYGKKYNILKKVLEMREKVMYI